MSNPTGATTVLATMLCMQPAGLARDVTVTLRHRLIVGRGRITALYTKSLIYITLDSLLEELLSCLLKGGRKLKLYV